MYKNFYAYDGQKKYILRGHSDLFDKLIVYRQGLFIFNKYS